MPFASIRCEAQVYRNIILANTLGIQLNMYNRRSGAQAHSFRDYGCIFVMNMATTPTMAYFRLKIQYIPWHSRGIAHIIRNNLVKITYSRL